MNLKLNNFTVFATLIVILSWITSHLIAQDIDSHPPYSTNKTQLTIWNGTEYIPFFIKGINLGIAKPGTFPGQLDASKEDYLRWFPQIKEAGFNCIRLYTLHFPQFYEALHEYNSANLQNPLLFIQGVWLEEELASYDEDLYFLSNFFKNEMEENVDALHGNRQIEQRFGKAYGNFSVDVSKWNLAYILGREVHPPEVLHTNESHPTETAFQGTHFSISEATASEVWLTKMLDHIVSFENNSYQTQRPVSASSWPTLDPLDHPEVINVYEDMAQIDLSKIQLKNAPAGLFISYHAYPYYPDFISLQSSYQNYADDYGPNSYMGYLDELKTHYKDFPLIIAEYGVPSSWVIAQYTTSGMNHGGFDEYNQGLTNIRMLNTIRTTNGGGGFQFAWMDEWFKRTWVTDPVDFIPDSRVLWHNIASAEQNYGLLGFAKEKSTDTLARFTDSDRIQHLSADGNYTFFEIEIGLKEPLDLPDELWISLDTYDETLGESILPTGDTVPSRAEFALKITNYDASLYVTQAYDIFGIWHNFSEPEQIYRSIPTDGSPWEIVRIRNNASHSDVQYIGNLKVNYDFQPQSSNDGVTIGDSKITIRIPWSYINVISPDQRRVLHDNRDTSPTEWRVSDGFSIGVLYKEQWYTHPDRYEWPIWTSVNSTNSKEYLKTSYYVMRDQLGDFNSQAIAVVDSFTFEGPEFPVTISASKGLLINDFDIDGDSLVSVLGDNPSHGEVNLKPDGSFTYRPHPDFIGWDMFSYRVFDGRSLSTPNFVNLLVEQNEVLAVDEMDIALSIFPIPSSDFLNIRSQISTSSVRIFDSNGKMVNELVINKKEFQLDIKNYETGLYILVSQVGNRFITNRFIKN